jgi:hypothetical protein
MRSRSVVLAVPLLLFPGAVALFSGGYPDVDRLRAGIAAWVLLAAVAIVLPRPLPRSRPAVVAVAALAGLTGWTALSLTWAPLGEPAGEDVQRMLVYLPVLVAAIAVLREPAAARLAEPLVLAGIAGATLYGLSERLFPGAVDLADVLSAGDRLAHPLTYWNATGAFAALGLVLAAAVGGDPGRPRWLRAAVVASAPVLGLALALTLSRGGIGTAVAGLAVLIALAPTRRRLDSAALVAGAALLAAAATVPLPALREVASASGQGAAMAVVLAVLAGAAAALQWRAAGTTGTELRRARPLAVATLVLALAATAVLAAQVERADTTGASRLASVQSNRYEYWKVAARSFADHPLIGVGAGGFQAEWLRERPFREGVRDAHSLYLETAAELGIVGLALLALLFGGIAAAARRALPALAGSVAALAAWALHAGLDWDWEMPALTLVAIVLAGHLLAGRTHTAAVDARGRRARLTSPAAVAAADGRDP